MKKSERYYMAMLAVINSTNILADAKIEILETLINDKNVAEFTEKRDAEAEDDF